MKLHWGLWGAWSGAEGSAPDLSTCVCVCVMEGNAPDLCVSVCVMGAASAQPRMLCISIHVESIPQSPCKQWHA
eukprot:972705-Pelagomonas_calceolata.AAC.1